jgi:hypothetical protein
MKTEDCLPNTNGTDNQQVKVEMLHSKLRNILTLALATLPAISCPAQADPPPVEIPLANTGFENDLNDWLPIPTDYQGQVSVVQGNAHDGVKSLRIEGTTNQNAPFLMRASGPLEGGATYRFSAWVRSDNAPGVTDAAVKIENYNAAGTNTNGVYGQKTMDASGSWTQVSVTLLADHDTTNQILYLRVLGAGTVYFDDVKLEKVIPAPDLILQADSRRRVVPANTATSIQVKVKVTQPNLPGLAQNFALALNTPAGVTSLTPTAQPQADGIFALSATVPALAEGEYQMTVKNTLLNSQPVVHVNVPIVNRKPNYLTNTGTILHNGQPFFPIGMYHPEHNATDLKLLADNGFNAVQGSFATDLTEFKDALDLAAAHGLAVDVPLYVGAKVAENLPASLAKINQFANHPAIYTWKIIDEPEILPAIADEVAGVYRALKAADPNHPFELTLCEDATVPYWVKFCDLVQIDRYPVPGHSLTEVSTFTRNTYQAMEPWQNLTYVVQCGWVPNLSNQPSVPQARSMVYLALINGAKGIYWYAMYDPNWNLTTSPLWPHMKGINEEIQSLSVPLMLGTQVQDITHSNSNVHVRGVQHNGKLYVLITNPEDAAATGTLTLPNTVNVTSVQTLGQTAITPVTSHQITVDLGAIDSRTLVFNLQ